MLKSKELSREQVYWLPATEIASQSSTPAKPVAPFVHTRPVKSDVHKKVKEFERIFDELDADYERILLEKKNMQIENKNLLIKNECLIANSIANDICSIALAYDLVVPPSSNSSHCMYKVTNANLNRCYQELSKANTHLRTTSLEKIAAQKAEIATLNAETVGNKTSGTTKPANLKVITPGMYAIRPKYIIPQRRTNRETLIPLPKKKQVTFQETPKPSPRCTKKPVAPLLKKPNVNVPLSTGIKSATGASKPASKRNAWIYRKLPAKSAKGEKVEEHIRNVNKNNRVDSHVKRFVSVKNLNAVCGACHECLISSNHDNCLVYSVKSVNRKQPKAKNTVRTTKKVWRPKGWKAGSKGIPAMFE
uniref:Integrase, catalytic region, zinc finger, CCHC-type, peptidase aspartic, catalytic n=1 Tax=Tanacetum cinerariifolium TaxID=118510 RepID=A0A6L2LB99_TANCI|nr:hypothetical protein [Tanacetum cinerariifolium]